MLDGVGDRGFLWGLAFGSVNGSSMTDDCRSVKQSLATTNCMVEYDRT